MDARLRRGRARHAALPLTIVIATLGGWLLSMRNTMISVLGSDYVNLARARGPVALARRAALRARNAAAAQRDEPAWRSASVLGGSLLTESCSAIPGQATCSCRPVRNQDYPLMQGIFLVITLAVLAANWMVDLVYLWLDARGDSAS